jgi:transposase, IS5 family
VRKLGGLVRRVKRRGVATRTRFRDRSRSAGRRLKQISRTLRRRTGQAPAEVDRLTAQVAGIARRTLGQAERVARNARRAWASGPVTGGCGGCWTGWSRPPPRPGGCWTRPANAWVATG